MPKNYGVKEQDQVVAHVVDMILTGKLRSGDRLDRNQIAAELGLSRVPVQEAVIALEHVGVVSTRYHRGAYVERFDESVLLEHHALYGVLNGTASARAAAAPTPKLLEQLEPRLAALRNSVSTKAFPDDAWRFRKIINDAYAGPRLSAAIRAAQVLMPPAFWSTYLSSHPELLGHYEAEYAAVRDGQPAAAREACVVRSAVLGRVMVAELVRRRVLGPGSHLVPPAAL